MLIGWFIIENVNLMGCFALLADAAARAEIGGYIWGVELHLQNETVHSEKNKQVHK